MKAPDKRRLQGDDNRDRSQGLAAKSNHSGLYVPEEGRLELHHETYRCESHWAEPLLVCLRTQKGSHSL